MIRWISKKPRYGDHIRVSRGYYYHHGIYFFPWRVIHFSAYNVDGEEGETSAQRACIIKTTFKDFHRGDRVEVRVLSDEEKKSKRKWWQVARIAKGEVGKRRGTYNIIKNNCEHFVNEVLFGVRYSEQSAHPIRHVLQLGDQRRLNKEHEEEKERQKKKRKWWQFILPKREKVAEDTPPTTNPKNKKKSGKKST